MFVLHMSPQRSSSSISDFRPEAFPDGLFDIVSARSTTAGSAPVTCAPLGNPCWLALLTFVLLHQLVDLLLHRLEVERCRVLHRWVFDCSLRQLTHRLLN